MLYIMIKNNNIYYQMVIKVPKKKSLALKWVQLGPKRGQKEVLSHFLGRSVLVFADFAYYR